MKPLWVKDTLPGSLDEHLSQFYLTIYVHYYLFMDFIDKNTENNTEYGSLTLETK